MIPATTLPAATRGDTPAPAPADLRWFVFALFFVFGGITSLNDVLIPKLKHLFELSYFEVLLIQSAFFAAYLLISLPAAALVKRLGYMRTAVAGLAVMTLGCLLFIPASMSGVFAAFLGALFVLAAGITTVQVVTNPLISLLGHPATAHSRLTFAQAFNSLGTTVAPYVGAIVILGALPTADPATLDGAALAAFRTAETRVIVVTYLVIAAALALVAAAVWWRRNRLVEPPSAATSLFGSLDLLRRPRFAFGALGIFVYVGAEVAIGSLLVNFLIQRDAMAIADVDAGKLVALYWGGAMVGRFVGAALLRRFAPGGVLAVAAIVAASLCAVAMLTTGDVSGWALLAVGLFNSIMFPTIFALASEGLGDRTADGSGLICVAIVGGAIVPLAAGLIADAANLRAALLVPVACYAVIVGFGLFCKRARVQSIA